MTGFKVDMSPLERGTRSIGRSLVDVGQTIGGAMQRSNQQEQQQQEQGDIEAFMRQAMDGDQVALKELMVKSPQAARMVAEHIQSQQAGQQVEQDRFTGEVAENTAGFVEQMHLAPQEQQEAMFNSAIDDPRYDIDEEDRTLFMDVNARKAIIGKVKGKEYAESFFGGDDSGLTSGEREFNALTAGMTPEDVIKAKRIKLKLDQGAGTAKGSITTTEDKIKLSGMKEGMTMNTALNTLDKAKESQSKNGGFALTMNRGLDKLKELDSKGFEPKDIAMVQTFLAGKPLGSYIMSENEQLYSGAIESMINAIARRESGAAIGEEETQRFFGRYMPQAGDTDARIKQKRNALEGQFRSIRGQSGRVYDALRVTMGEEEKPVLSDEDLLKKYGG